MSGSMLDATNWNAVKQVAGAHAVVVAKAETEKAATEIATSIAIQINEDVAGNVTAAVGAAEAAAGSASLSGQSATAAEEARQISEDQAVAASTAAASAATAAATALAGANVFATIAAGLAATPEGETFNVAGAGEVYATTYRKTGGAAVLVGVIASKQAIDGVPAKAADMGAIGGLATPFAVTDAAGNVIARGGPTHFASGGLWVEYRADGSWVVEGPMGPVITVSPAGEPSYVGSLISAGELDGADIAIISRDTGEYQAASFSSTDGALRLLGYSASAGGGGSTGYGDFTAADVGAAHVAAADYSSKVRRRDLSAFPTITASDLVLVLGWGQSFATGWEGYPAISKSGLPPGLFMLGGSVHSTSESANGWTPIGGLAMNPLQANVLSLTDPRAVLTDAAVAALSDTGNNVGEVPAIAAAAELRRRWDAARGLPQGDSTPWLVMTAGSGGRTALALRNTYFGRFQRAVDLAYDQAVAAGKQLLVVVTYIQGEADYSNGATYEAYLADLTSLFTQMRTYVEAKTGSSRLVPIYLHQTGAQYANDAQDLSVGRAQIQIAQDLPGIVLVGNTQPVPDKGDHLTANGYRWLGAQAGKAMARTLVERRGYECSRVLDWSVRGTTLMARVHVEDGPIRWDAPYINRAVSTFSSLPSRGVYATDSEGEISLTNPTMAAGQVLIWTLGRAPTGPLRVWVGRKGGTNGSICISDSDETLLADRYSYIAGSGQPAGDNITDLAGYRYPARNFVLADVQTATPV